MGSITDSLNEEQKKAVLQTEGPVLILAGAGSGKTRVLTHRIAYLIDTCGVNPWNILAITFTNKAAGEMRERVDKIVGYGAESIWVSTFHATCVRILRRYADLIGYDSHFVIYDSDDSKNLMKDICKRYQVETQSLKQRQILNKISSLKDSLCTPNEYSLSQGYDPDKQRIAKAYQEYQASLKKNNAMDFDDLIMNTVLLFREHPEALETYQDRFRYIMVDEYQDTNTAQFELIRLLASKYRNLCVVGDDDQSIYRFRGANIRNILDFESIYTDAVTIKLEQNYRSTQNILDAANAVIRNNTGRKAKSLWTEEGEGEQVHMVTMASAQDEASFIAETVGSFKAKGKADYRDMAVLYRTNAQSRLIEEKFVLAGIPYDLVGGTNFYARREIRDLLGYLKTIDNAVDDLAVRRIINVPKRGIGATTLEKVQTYADGHNMNFFDALSYADEIVSGKAAGKLREFVAMIQSFRSLQKAGSLEELIRSVIDEIDYEEYLRKLDEEDEDKSGDNDRRNNVEELIAKVIQYEESAEETSLSGFLEEVALIADIDKVTEDDDKVLLMTLHSAKGLEFGYVFLAGMEENLFPSYQTIQGEDSDPLGMEEERRLAYVGITRAKKELFLTAARMRFVHGEPQMNQVSRFVEEIPENLLDVDEYGGSFGGYRGGFGSGKTNVWAGYGEDEQPGYQGGAGSFGSSAGGYGGSGKKPERTGRGRVYGGDIGHRTSEGYVYGGSKEPVTQAYGSSIYGEGRTPGKPYTGYSGTDSLGRPKASLAPRKPRAVGKKPFVALQSMKGAPTAPQTLDYGVGDRVRHVKYGVGTVSEIEETPRDFKVTVQFDEAGQKIMFAAFAKLQKVE